MSLLCADDLSFLWYCLLCLDGSALVLAEVPLGGDEYLLVLAPAVPLGTVAHQHHGLEIVHSLFLGRDSFNHLLRT